MKELTSSQLFAYEDIVKYIKDETILCVCGKQGSGRSKVINRYLNDFNGKTKILHPEDFFSSNIKDVMSLSKRIDDILKDLDNYDLVYIKSFEYLVMVSSNYKFGLYQLAYNLWINFLKRIKIKAIISCANKRNAIDIINDHTWIVEVKITKQDRIDLLNQLLDDKELIDKIYPLVNGVKLRNIRIAVNQTNKKSPTNWYESFISTLAILDSKCLDIEDKVVKPEFEYDMVGLDNITSQITKDVIGPLELGDQYIPICKGILLHGPPGTGKSTIGRWLSYKLKGRVYLAESSSRQTLISSFSDCLKLACENSPSVVFLDDFESILDNPHSVRELYVLLDGINTSGRENVCVIATCMNIDVVPEALIRGGRFERCIEFSNPNYNTILSIIKNRFSRVQNSNSKAAHLIRIEEEEYKIMAQNLMGWSASNIHLVIDSTLRSILLGGKIYDIFVKEASKVEKQNKLCLNYISSKKPQETIYF